MSRGSQLSTSCEPYRPDALALRLAELALAVAVILALGVIGIQLTIRTYGSIHRCRE